MRHLADQCRGKWISWALAGAMFCGIFAFSAHGQDLDAKVRLRLKEMKGDNDQAAQVAEMELLTMGDKALEPLKKIIDDAKDAERAEALSVYPKALEKAGRLTRVSLDFDRARLQDVVEVLNRQCKAVKLDAGNSGSFPRVTIHREQVPYGRALAEICRMGDGTLSEDGTSFISISREPGSGNRPIWEEWGSMVILDRIKYRNKLNFDDMKRDGPNLELTLKLILDPGMLSIVGGVFKDVLAEDEAGNALAVQTRRDNLSYDYSPWGMVRTRKLTLSAPEGSRKIAILKGKVMEFIGGDMEKWEIDDIEKAAGMSHEFGSMKAEIQSFERTGELLNIRMSLSGVPKPESVGDPRDIQMFNRLFNGALKAESEDGKDNWFIQAVLPGSGLSPDDFMVQMRNFMGKTDKKVKLTVRMPKKFEEVWIGFEFKDIDLF